MEESINELKDRHAKGTNEVDDPDRAPTGSAYKMHAQMQREKMAEERRRVQENQRLKAMQEEAKNVFADKNNEQGAGDDDGDDDDKNGNNAYDEDSDDEWDDLLNDDNELLAIRERRLREMREKQMKAAEPTKTLSDR